MQSRTNVKLQKSLVAQSETPFKGSTNEKNKKGYPKGKETKNNKKEMTDETIMLMKNRQQLMPRNDTEYKMLSKNIRKKCKKAKDAWFNKKNTIIETYRT